jgi:hypothetical protein
MIRKTKSWQLKMDDAPHARLCNILAKWGYHEMSDPLREVVENIFAMDEQGQEPHQKLTLRLKRRS